MRVSTIKGDAGYSQWRVGIENGKKFEVYLDGSRQTHCYVADTDAGFVKRCVLNSEGKCQCDPSDPEKIWVERVEGDVRVEFV